MNDILPLERGNGGIDVSLTHTEEDSGIVKHKIEFRLLVDLARPFCSLQRLALEVLEQQE
jgi:hypothetical protein